MAEQKYDILVLGGGVGGYPAAVRAAKLGLRAAVVEAEALGGTCLNWGCIPTKTLLNIAQQYRELSRLSRYGINVENVNFDFAQVVARSRKTAALLSAGVGHLLKNNGVDQIKGRGRLVGSGKIEVSAADGSKKVVQGKRIIVASGGKPKSIPGVEIDRLRIISSRQALALKEVPKKLIIIGAGAIGVEFAYFFATFGCEVHLLEALPNILPAEDDEVSQVLAKAFRKYKINAVSGVKVENVVSTTEKVQVSYAAAGQEMQKIEAPQVLMAVGVSGNIDDLGLEDVGVELRDGFIKVDPTTYQTTCEGVFAVGDVIGPPLLAHVATAEAVHAINCIGGIKCVPLDYGNIPQCTYCQPQVASLGLTEKQALEKGHKLKIGRFPFAASGKAIAVDHSEGFVKLVFDADYGELLGAHIIGQQATELIAELGVAKTLGTTYKELATTIHAHPTLSEGIMEAAADAFGESVNI